jgi:hypothetical protein
LLIVVSGLQLPSGALAQARKSIKPRVTTSVAGAPKADSFVADTIVLKDGKTLKGQIVDGPPRLGQVYVVARRSWVAKNLPEWSPKWEKLEAEANRGAELNRRQRLEAWRQDRSATKSEPNDRINAWLDRELAKPAADPKTSAPLMVVRLNRSEIKSTYRRTPMAQRAIRLAWTLGLEDVETMRLGEVKTVLEGRGLLADGDGFVSIDGLLPMGPESDVQWLLRRAATELMNDEGLRFVRYGGAILPEPRPGEAPNMASATSGLASTLKELLGEAPVDPLPPVLNQVAMKGKVAALVTKLDMASDLSTVTVEATLYVYQNRNGWTRGATRSGTLRVGDAPQAAVDAIAQDPQIKSAFGLMDSIGIFQISDDMKRKSLSVGATTQQALGIARGAVNRDITALAIPLEDQGQKPAGKP